MLMGRNARPAAARRGLDVPDGRAHLSGSPSTTVSNKKDEFGRVETIVERVDVS